MEQILFSAVITMAILFFISSCIKNNFQMKKRPLKIVMQKGFMNVCAFVFRCLPT